MQLEGSVYYNTHKLKGHHSSSNQVQKQLNCGPEDKNLIPCQLSRVKVYTHTLKSIQDCWTKSNAKLDKS